MADMRIARPSRLLLQHRDHEDAVRIEAELHIAMMIRWLARQTILTAYKANRLPEPHPVALANAVTAYIIENKSRLRIEARLALMSVEWEDRQS
jgi:hypothetical protein